MIVVIRDPMLAEDYRAKRQEVGNDKWDEVWDGVYIVPPLLDNTHQSVASGLAVRLYLAVKEPGLGIVRNGTNVSDRAADWMFNFRCPDIAVYLKTNPSINHSSHWQGGPDLAVEIISPGEDPLAKFAFYAAVDTREVLVVHRDPWAVELFQLAGGTLVLAGRSDLANPVVIASSVLPVAFSLAAGRPRPVVQITHAVTGQVWTA